ncbi:hypothetical protein ACFQY8_02190 [Alloscardovia venturai]|uniref:Uncharacterized protein n=1 Tax=Alloscardovia venturai TaxID=1769421 RepID=A0ABW2Y460_9BIFI
MIDKATPYISLAGYSYILDASASKVLTEQEMQAVQEQIKQTNAAIRQAIQETASEEIQVTRTTDKVIFTDVSTETANRPIPLTRAGTRYKEGATKVEFGWYWFANLCIKN